MVSIKETFASSKNYRMSYAAHFLPELISPSSRETALALLKTKNQVQIQHAFWGGIH